MLGGENSTVRVNEQATQQVNLDIIIIKLNFS